MAVTTKAGPLKTLGPCEAINSVIENEKPDEDQVFHTSAILSRARMRSPFNHSPTLPSLYKYPTPSTHNPLFCPLWVWSDRERTQKEKKKSLPTSKQNLEFQGLKAKSRKPKRETDTNSQEERERKELSANWILFFHFSLLHIWGFIKGILSSYNANFVADKVQSTPLSDSHHFRCKGGIFIIFFELSWEILIWVFLCWVFNPCCFCNWVF